MSGEYIQQQNSDGENSKKKIILTFIGILILSSIGFGIWYFLSNYSSEPSYDAVPQSNAQEQNNQENEEANIGSEVEYGLPDLSGTNSEFSNPEGQEEEPSTEPSTEDESASGDEV